MLSIGKLGSGPTAADYYGNADQACRAVSAGYASLVLSWARRYGTTVAGVPDAAAVAVRAATSQLGTPYLWGGDGPGGFDCSGLVQWAYARAGVLLPRVAQDQYDAGPAVPNGSPLRPGDLVFFGAGPRRVTHVQICGCPSGRLAPVLPRIGITEPEGVQA